MRNLYLLLLTVILSSCALTPSGIGLAESEANGAVVFDIDGTLTPDVYAVFSARDGAADAVNTFADSEVEIIYLSARVTMLQSGIPGWLEKNGFPEGRIHVTETREDRQDHAAFKKRILEAYSANGWTFIAAYGDSSTDFAAYAAAGIEQQRVFALKREGEEDCQPGTWAACYAGWNEQAQTIRQLIDAAN